MTDTPRTDAYVEKWAKDRTALWPDFARQLERELNVLKTEMDSGIRNNQETNTDGTSQLHMHGTGQQIQPGSLNGLEDQKTETQRWKTLCHELAACLGCGCTTQHGLCVQCHKAQKRYHAVQKPLR